MESLLTIAQLLALLSAAALCVYLIVVLVRFKDVLALLQKDLALLSERSRPVFDNLEVITSRLKSVATTLEEHVSVTRGSLEAVREMAENVLAFERRIQESLEEPVLRVTSLLAAIIDRITSRISRSRSD